MTRKTMTPKHFTGPELETCNFRKDGTRIGSPHCMNVCIKCESHSEPGAKKPWIVCEEIKNALTTKMEEK